MSTGWKIDKNNITSYQNLLKDRWNCTRSNYIKIGLKCHSEARSTDQKLHKKTNEQIKTFNLYAMEIES